MKTQPTLKKQLLFLLFPFFVFSEAHTQNLDLSKTVSNITTGGNGTSASQYDILEYTIVAKNLGASSVTNASLYDYIPAGSSYVAGSTSLNGTAVADVGGNMPFAGSGGMIRSQFYSSGVLAYNLPATVKFRVRVNANGGTITNYASLSATYNGSAIAYNTNTVFTNLTPDATCSVIYQSTTSTQGGSPPYQYIRSLNTTNGTGGSVLFNGATGPCFNAITGASLSAGTVLVYTAAIAYDKNSNRIYFVNNNSSAVQDLSYIDLNTSPVSAKRFVGYPLETTTGAGWNINRMAFASDGYGYAITQNATDIIRFHINSSTGLPVITRLGALINDVNNGTNNILSESGGDIFGDGSGNLYLVANSSKLYKINPNTRLATFLGSVNPFPGTSNSIAIDATGKVYIGGAYQNVYTVNLATMAATSITSGSTNVWTNGDYTSCAFPVLAPSLAANKTYANISNHAVVIGGDTVEYTIEVINSGNINAAGVKLYDSIPGATTYIPGSTRLNGILVPDVSGIMPFSVFGGKLINSPGEQGGIIKPGIANKAIVTFRTKTTGLKNICNQSRITLVDADGNTIFINSDDPLEPGSQNSTCFFSDGVLPLNDLIFTGKITKEGTLLNWSISNEQNASHYEVEYATHENNFFSLGKINARELKEYSFTNKLLNSSTNVYYRLKVVYRDGSYNYSRTIQLRNQQTSTKVYPNPFVSDVMIQFSLEKIETVKIKLMDIEGRVLIEKNKQQHPGFYSILFNVPKNLSAGIYILKVLAGEKMVLQEKLVKQF